MKESELMMTAKTVKTKSRKRSKRRAMKVEDLTRFVVVSDPQVSPDGSRQVFVRRHFGEKNDYVNNLWMTDCAGESDPVQFTNGERDGSPRWSPDGSTVAFVSARDKTRPQIYTIDPAGGEAVALTSFPQGSIASFKWSPDGKMLAVLFRKGDPNQTEAAADERKKKGLSDPPKVIEGWWWRLDGDGYFLDRRHELYLVDVATGKHKKVYGKDAFGFISFDFSPDSKKMVIASNRDRNAMIRPWKYELLILTISTGKLKVVPNMPWGPKDSVAWSPDGQFIAYAGRIGEDSAYSTENLELFVCDPVRGKPRSLTGKEDYCLMAATLSDMADMSFDANIKWSPNSKRIFIGIGWHGEAHVASVARRGGALTFHTSGAAVHSMGNLSRDGRTMSMTIDSAVKPIEVGVGRLSSVSGPIAVTPLSEFNAPLLKELSLSKPTSQWLTTADGTKVQVWTMKPVGFSPSGRKKYPAVLEVHGGPHAQYGVCFFHEFQLLTAQGYVVFFSNPRGSKGYGQDHCSAIRGSWGRDDWTDMQAVIEHMENRSFVDAKRMGIMGGSYGGYMTNWAIGHTHVFAGAISDRSVSNLVSMAGNSDFYDVPDRYWEGNAWDRPEARWNSSPVKYFNDLKTPTLVIHSESDLRCNIEQADQVYAALKLNRVPTRYVRYPASTSHGMSRNGPPDMRLHRLGQILDWWSRYLKK